MKVTKKSPVFLIQSDNGSFPSNTIECQLGDSLIDVHTTDYQTAVSMAIGFCEEVSESYSKFKVSVYMLDGSIDESGEISKKRCFSISSAQARKYGVVK